jgi:hypothetical protein
VTVGAIGLPFSPRARLFTTSNKPKYRRQPAHCRSVARPRVGPRMTAPKPQLLRGAPAPGPVLTRQSRHVHEHAQHGNCRVLPSMCGERRNGRASTTSSRISSHVRSPLVHIFGIARTCRGGVVQWILRTSEGGVVWPTLELPSAQHTHPWCRRRAPCRGRAALSRARGDDAALRTPVVIVAFFAMATVPAGGVRCRWRTREGEKCVRSMAFNGDGLCEWGVAGRGVLCGGREEEDRTGSRCGAGRVCGRRKRRRAAARPSRADGPSRA